MDSAVLEKTLEVLKSLSELESALGEFYLYCSGVRETEKEFWVELADEERNHARNIEEAARMVREEGSLIVPSASFNEAPIQQAKHFIARTLKRLESSQIPNDFKTLLSIAWNIEYSILEIKYHDLFSIAEQGYHNLLQDIVAETTDHRGKLGARITALRNNTPRARSRQQAKIQTPARKEALPPPAAPARTPASPKIVVRKKTQAQAR
ncbi:MAG TPA: hypothetical protein VLS90_01170 [Thermodesulfobacteriota bacterium]|nr:hypothetical protein [Thermodesulfobacteriota bacterium]